VTSTERVTRSRGRPRDVSINLRIVEDVLREVEAHGPLPLDDLRMNVRGQARRVDLVVRALVASGRLVCVSGRYVLGSDRVGV
jgi:hypothetical protein